MITLILYISLALISLVLMVVVLVWAHNHFIFRTYPVRKIISIFDYDGILKTCTLEGIENNDGIWELVVAFADCKSRITCRVETNSSGYPIYAFLYVPLSRDEISAVSKSFRMYFAHRYGQSSADDKMINLIPEHLEADSPEIVIDLVHATHAEMVLQTLLQKQAQNGSSEYAKLSLQL